MYKIYRPGHSGATILSGTKKNKKKSNFEILKTSECGGYYLIQLKSERTEKWVAISEVSEKGIATAYYDASYTFMPPKPKKKDWPW